MSIKLVDRITMLQFASCCTFTFYLLPFTFHNHQINNLNWNEFIYSVYFTKQPRYLSKKNDARLQLSTKICYICINFQLFCSKENSQTRTIGMIKLYVINSSKRFEISVASLVSDKFVSSVKIFLYKTHTSFVTFGNLLQNVVTEVSFL